MIRTTLSHRTIPLLIAALLTATAMSNVGAQQMDTSLASGRVGQLEIGMPIDSVLGIVGRDHVRLVDLDLEGQFAPALEIDLPGGPRPSLVARFREWPCGYFAIDALDVYDPRFRTSTGHGVGSSIAELRRAHLIHLNREEGHSVIVPALNMAFAIDGTSFADSVRATSVYLSLHPDSIRAKWCPSRD